MKPITVVLTQFARPHHLKIILESIVRQTEKADVFLWDNSGVAEAAEGQVEWYVRSSTNQYCWPRWFMATFARTEYVLILDDDLSFAGPDGLRAVLDGLANLDDPDQAVGPEGVILIPGEPYFGSHQGPPEAQVSKGTRGSIHVRRPGGDTRVDIVKGRAFACRTQALRQLPVWVDYAERADDIAVSALLARGRPRWHVVSGSLNRTFADMPDADGPMALSSAPHWKDTREKARQVFFQR